MDQPSNPKLPPSRPTAFRTVQGAAPIASNSPAAHKRASAAELPAHIQTGLEQMYASASRPFPRSYQRLVVENIALMRDFRAANATWRQVAEQFGAIGLPISQQCLRAMVSRAERELRDAGARGTTWRAVPQAAAAPAAAVVGAAAPVARSRPDETQHNETQHNETRQRATETKRHEAKRDATQQHATLRNEAQGFVAKDLEQKRRMIGLPAALRARAARIDLKPRSR